MPLLPKGAARSVFTFTLLLGALSGAVQVHAQVRNDLVGKYRPYEYMIPMRDGVKLYTIVWVPKGVPGKKPILMQRTPYGAGSPSAGAPRASNRVLVNAGFIFAYQDVRASPREILSTFALSLSGVRRGSTNRPTPTTPSTSWSKTCTATTARWAFGGSPIRGFTLE
jgi:hypothetical protein